MYTLHIANKIYSSWSLRPWLLMQALQIPFTEEVHPFATGSNRASFSKFSPTGKVPCLHSDEHVIWDSLAIAEYLAERHDGIWPDDPSARAWARCASAEMHSGFQALRQHCPMHCGLRLKLHSLPEAAQHDIDRIIELWSEGLSRFGGPYLAGPKFTAVDAFFAPVVIRFQSYGMALNDAAAQYRDHMLGLPALQAWITAALEEPWREPGHEQAVLAVGEVVMDLRDRPAI